MLSWSASASAILISSSRSTIRHIVFLLSQSHWTVMKMLSSSIGGARGLEEDGWEMEDVFAYKGGLWLAHLVSWRILPSPGYIFGSWMMRSAFDQHPREPHCLFVCLFVCLFEPHMKKVLCYRWPQPLLCDHVCSCDAWCKWQKHHMACLRHGCSPCVS